MMASPAAESDAESKIQPVEKNERQHLQGCCELEKAKKRLFRWVSYFSGDMKVFGEWMKG